jgi:PAS domain S-box-containing protein
VQQIHDGMGMGIGIGREFLIAARRSGKGMLEQKRETSITVVTARPECLRESLHLFDFFTHRMNSRSRIDAARAAALLGCLSADASQFIELLAALPGVVFFIKDTSGRFVACNDALVRILGCERESQVVGKTDVDFVPPEVAEQYLAEDRLVLESGKPLARYAQMVPHVGGPWCWYFVSKSPLRDARGTLRGVVVVMQEMQEFRGVTGPFVRLQPALRFIHANFREPLDMKAVAAHAGLSASQFTRLFKRFMALAPMQYVIRQRIHAACHELLTTDRTAGQIAHDVGFCDQSAFTRAFKEVTGQTPARYRQQHLAEWAQRRPP